MTPLLSDRFQSVSIRKVGQNTRNLVVVTDFDGVDFQIVGHRDVIHAFLTDNLVSIRCDTALWTERNRQVSCGHTKKSVRFAPLGR